MAVGDARGKASHVQVAPSYVHTRAHGSSSVTILTPQVPCNRAASLWMKKAPLWRLMPRFPRACLPPGSVSSQGQRAQVTRPGPLPRTRAGQDGVSVLHLCCALLDRRTAAAGGSQVSRDKGLHRRRRTHTHTPPSRLPCRPAELHHQLQVRSCH